MFEVEATVRRDAFLRSVGGIERCIYFALGDERIDVRAEGDIERTRESDGKASAVHFFHFDFTPGQVERWRAGEGSAMLVIDHPNYGHAALIGPETCGFLARECFA